MLLFIIIYYYFETSLLLYPFYDLMIFIHNPKELKLSLRKQYKKAKGPQLGGVVLSSALPGVSMTCMTFDEVGAPARLSSGPSPATNIPAVHNLLMALVNFDLEPKEPRKRYEKNGRDTAIIFVQKSSKSAQ